IRVAAAAAAEKCAAASLADSILFLTIFGEEIHPDCPPLPSRLRRAVIIGEGGVRAEYKGLQAFLPPLTAMQEGWDVQDLFEALAHRVAPPPDLKVDPVAEKSRLLSVIADSGFRFFVSPAVIWASLPAAPAPLRIRRLGSLVRLEDINAEAIAAAVAKSISWLEQQAAPDGGLPGICDLRHGKQQPAALREQALVAAALGSAVPIAPAGAKLGQRLLAKVMTNYREDPQKRIGFLAEGEEVEIGAPAAALLALLKLDMAKNDERAPRLAAFLKGMRHPEGRFELFYPPRDATLPEAAYPRIADAQTALLAWAKFAADGETIKWLRQGLAYDCERLDRTQDLGLAPGLARVCALLGPQQAEPAMIDLV
ncbi:MAG: hypothetical protein N3A66_11820, partial [Planctomycetota bacterium]|nr:hypothetical protein [Planctomycetota bacterium]